MEGFIALGVGLLCWVVYRAGKRTGSRQGSLAMLWLSNGIDFMMLVKGIGGPPAGGPLAHSL